MCSCIGLLHKGCPIVDCSLTCTRWYCLVCSPLTYVCVVILSQVVAQNASALLTFLKQNCREEASTYWLFREAGDQLVRLYDYSVLPPQQQRKWKYTMAMLYYRCATRAARNHSNSTQVRLKCALHYGLWLCMCRTACLIWIYNTF